MPSSSASWRASDSARRNSARRSLRSCHALRSRTDLRMRAASRVIFGFPRRRSSSTSRSSRRRRSSSATSLRLSSCDTRRRSNPAASLISIRDTFVIPRARTDSRPPIPTGAIPSSISAATASARCSFRALSRIPRRYRRSPGFIPDAETERDADGRVVAALRSRASRDSAEGARHWPARAPGFVPRSRAQRMRAIAASSAARADTALRSRRRFSAARSSGDFGGAPSRRDRRSARSNRDTSAPLPPHAGRRGDAERGAGRGETRWVEKRDGEIRGSEKRGEETRGAVDGRSAERDEACSAMARVTASYSASRRR